MSRPLLPFPESLCHRCDAPPRYVGNARGSVFILCPRWPSKYPPQPVRACASFAPRAEDAEPVDLADTGDDGP